MSESSYRTLHAPRPQEMTQLDAEQLRSNFLIDHIFADNQVSMVFTDLDRMALGGVKPLKPVILGQYAQTGTSFFLERREMGVLNIGGPGAVEVDGKRHELNPLDCLYVGMGSREIRFSSRDDANPARFYLLSCPAHQTYPTTLIRKSDCEPIALGSKSSANERKIYQYIHPKGIKSCQLVMGWTELADGSVWNTMPPHTHSRRTEIYFYFDLGDSVVVHLLGDPQATRHLFVQNEQAVLSPSWSIHCGSGTSRYNFIWAMAGENQTFDDMDKIDAKDLR